MKYMLDTNACIRFLNGKSPNLRKKIREHRREDIVLCSMVRGELLVGARKHENSEQLMLKRRTFLEQFESFPFDDDAADKYSEIKAFLETTGQIIGGNDLIISAIALSNNVTLVTHNTREFNRVPNLIIEDWEI